MARRTTEQRKAICEAIAARDPDLAAARMESHLQQIAGLYWQVRGSVA